MAGDKKIQLTDFHLFYLPLLFLFFPQNNLFLCILESFRWTVPSCLAVPLHPRFSSFHRGCLPLSREFDFCGIVPLVFLFSLLSFLYFSVFLLPTINFLDVEFLWIRFIGTVREPVSQMFGYFRKTNITWMNYQNTKRLLRNELYSRMAFECVFRLTDLLTNSSRRRTST